MNFVHSSPAFDPAYLDRSSFDLDAARAQPSNLLSPSGITNGSPHRTEGNPLWKDGKAPDAYLQAIDHCKTEVEGKGQEVAYQELNEALTDEALAIGTATRPETYAFGKGVSGVTFDPRDDIVLTEAKMA